MRGGTTRNGIEATCRVRPPFPSAVRVMSMKSPPPACFWSATRVASSPARPSTSTAARRSTDPVRCGPSFLNGRLVYQVEPTFDAVKTPADVVQPHVHPGEVQLHSREIAFE